MMRTSNVQTSFWWNSEANRMEKCGHHVITKAWAKRKKGWRICSICQQEIWLPINDEQYQNSDGTYNEEKITKAARRDGLNYGGKQ